MNTILVDTSFNDKRENFLYPAFFYQSYFGAFYEKDNFTYNLILTVFSEFIFSRRS